MHPDRRSHMASGYRSNCGRARTCAGRLSFAHTTLEEARTHVMLAVDRDKFYIHAQGKVRAALDFSGTQLPGWCELGDKSHEVRVAHRHGNTPKFAVCYLQRQFVL